MRMRWFYIFLAILVFLLMQVVVADRIAIGPITPDFLVLVVAFYALYRGAVQAAVFGFVIGFLQDLANPELLGLNALTKTILGFTVGKIGAKMVPDNIPFLFVLFMSVAFGHDIIYLLFYHWPHVGSSFAEIFSVALPSAAYTAIFGVLVQKLLALASPEVAKSLGQERQ
jgi:rod shape-determining protein MreD